MGFSLAEVSLCDGGGSRATPGGEGCYERVMNFSGFFLSAGFLVTSGRRALEDEWADLFFFWYKKGPRMLT